jgi:hypothetical protein
MYSVTLVVVPPGGGEADFSLKMKVPALPREGDYISVLRSYQTPPDEKYTGSEDFIVRRVWWNFEFPDDGKGMHTSGNEPVGEFKEIGIECEYAVGHYSSKAHKEAAGSGAKQFEASAY